MQDDTAAAEHHQVRITVDPNLGRVTVEPYPVYIAPGDRVDWTCEDGPFAIHFEPLSPLAHRRLRTPEGESTIGGDVRADIHPGSYRYFVAVSVRGQIYTEDPELIDENGDRTPPHPT